MLAALGTVVITSLSGVMMPGPMFAVTLAKSMKSPWAGVWVSLGHAVIEVPLIILIWFWVSRAQFFNDIWVQLSLGLVGGGMLTWMGIDMFRARKKAVQGGKDTRYNAFIAGIIMTGLNPFFLGWWVGVGIPLIDKLRGFGIVGLGSFIIVHWVCDLVWLSFVSVTVYKTHSFWNPRVHKWVFIVMSLLLFFFAGWFIVSGIQKVI